LCPASQVLDESFPKPRRQAGGCLRFHHHVQHLVPHRLFQHTVLAQHRCRLHVNAPPIGPRRHPTRLARRVTKAVEIRIQPDLHAVRRLRVQPFRGCAQFPLRQRQHRAVARGFDGKQRDPLACHPLPRQTARRDPQRRARKVERQNLAIASPAGAHLVRAALAQPYAVPRAGPFEHRPVNLVPVALQRVPSECAAQRKAERARTHADGFSRAPQRQCLGAPRSRAIDHFHALHHFRRAQS